MPRFFKIILDDTDIKELRIPKKIKRKYGSEISSSISLKVPNGAFWEVELTNRVDGMWLQNGWSEFAKHYSLSYGSFLVLRYEGNCNFHVVIFDKSATEMSCPCSGTHGSKVPNGEGFQDYAMEDNKDDTSVEIMDDIPPSKNSKVRSPSSSSRPHKKRKSTSRDNKSFEILDDIPPSKKTRMRSSSTSSKPCKKISSSSTTRVKDSDIKSSRVNSEPDFDAKRSGKRPQHMGVCSRTGTLRREERANALHLASSFRSENPYFEVVMQPSYLSGERFVSFQSQNYRTITNFIHWNSLF